MIKNYIYIFIISMVPVIELRGALPIGIAMSLNPILVYLVCVIGNLLPVPFLIKFAKVILEWCENLPKIGIIFTKILDLGRKKAAKINGALFVGLFLFVAVPLPGTGAWTGSLIATILDMPVKKAFMPIALGVICAGIIMFLGTLGVIALI